MDLSDLSSSTKDKVSIPTRDSLPIVNELTRRFALAPIREITLNEDANISRRGGRSTTELVLRLNENSRYYISEYLGTYKDTKAFNNYKVLTGVTNYND